MRLITRSAQLAMVLLLIVPAIAGPYEVARDAYLREDYATALSVWRPLAEQGEPRAQMWLGFMSETGRAVPQTFMEAAKWYIKAADQGEPRAQMMLGYLYESGRGVPQNYVRAHMWFSVSASAHLSNSD